MSTVLQDMLNHVVPVLVVQQLPVTFFDFIQRSSFLRLDTMLESISAPIAPWPGGDVKRARRRAGRGEARDR